MKNAFLNGDLGEEVYMDPPSGFEQKFGSKVCKLKKSLYRLKQSPRAWFERFTSSVKRWGYDQGHTDHTMFTKKSVEGKITIFIVYVDIILTRNDLEKMWKLKTHLASEFEIKDLGDISLEWRWLVPRKELLCFKKKIHTKIF